MLINRIGDLFLLFAIFFIYFAFDTLDYDVTFTLVPFFVNFYFSTPICTFSVIDFICLFLFLGAMGKSAQLGLHV
jgi:NADH-quinone oxidoreductase subunit L